MLVIFLRLHRPSPRPSLASQYLSPPLRHHLLLPFLPLLKLPREADSPFLAASPRPKCTRAAAYLCTEAGEAPGLGLDRSPQLS